MHFSISSLFIALCVTCFLIGILNFILTHKKSYRFFRIDILMFLILITILRICLPLELPFTKTIPASLIMNPLSDFLNFSIFENIQIIQLLIIVWIVGIIVNLIRYIIKLSKVNHFCYLIKNHSKHYKVSELLKKENEPNLDVYVSSYVSSPMVLGFKKNILLPNTYFSKQELECILMHEIEHIRNHDILIKNFINLLSIIYWWFFPIYLLRNNIDFFLEIRADYRVTNKLGIDKSLKYAESLLSVQKKLKNPKKMISSNISSYIIGENENILNYRIHYLFDNQYKKKTNKIALCLILLLPILSNAIILEPYYGESSKTNGTYSSEELFENGYLIENNDGSYSLYVEGKIIPIENPKSIINSGIEVEEEN